MRKFTNAISAWEARIIGLEPRSRFGMNKADLAKARSEVLHRAALQAGPDALKKFKPLTAADIQASEVEAMQKRLFDDFDAADRNWSKWKAL